MEQRQRHLKALSCNRTGLAYLKAKSRYNQEYLVNPQIENFNATIGGKQFLSPLNKNTPVYKIS